MGVDIKAIPTKYKGYTFRSRQEARWAVFFDYLGVEYEYEKEGFDLPCGYYLPDFWIPEWKAWIEIKGKEPTKKELEKLIHLSLLVGGYCFLFISPDKPGILVGPPFPVCEGQFAEGISANFLYSPAQKRIAPFLGTDPQPEFNLPDMNPFRNADDFVPGICLKCQDDREYDEYGYGDVDTYCPFEGWQHSEFMAEDCNALCRNSDLNSAIQAFKSADFKNGKNTRA